MPDTIRSTIAPSEKRSALGETLAESTVPFALSHGACYTCYQYGAICSNASSTARGDK